jgi:FtsH-binding integral membrane protein
VYLLLTLQLLVTTGLGYFAFNSPAFKETFASTAVVIVLSVAIMAISIVIACCTEFFRKYAIPLFIVFTILMAIMVAISICAYESKVVLTAAVITLVLAAALTLYACTFLHTQGTQSRISPKVGHS